MPNSECEKRHTVYIPMVPLPRTTWALIGPVVCIARSARALKVRFAGSRDPGVWVPESQLHGVENEIKQVGDTGILVIPEWLAKEKGWL